MTISLTDFVRKWLHRILFNERGQKKTETVSRLSLFICRNSHLSCFCQILWLFFKGICECKDLFSPFFTVFVPNRAKTHQRGEPLRWPERTVGKWVLLPFRDSEIFGEIDNQTVEQSLRGHAFSLHFHFCVQALNETRWIDSSCRFKELFQQLMSNVWIEGKRNPTQTLRFFNQNRNRTEKATLTTRTLTYIRLNLEIHTLQSLESWSSRKI